MICFKFPWAPVCLLICFQFREFITYNWRILLHTVLLQARVLLMQFLAILSVTNSLRMLSIHIKDTKVLKPCLSMNGFGDWFCCVYRQVVHLACFSTNNQINSVSYKAIRNSVSFIRMHSPWNCDERNLMMYWMSLSSTNWYIVVKQLFHFNRRNISVSVRPQLL